MSWIEIAILVLLVVLICLFVYSYIKIDNKLAEITLYVKEDYVSKKPTDNPRYKKVTLFGIQYKSIDEASNALGIPRGNLSRWLKNKNLKAVEKLVKDYQNGVIVNKIDYLSNPLFTPSSTFEINTPEELKDLVMKYLKKAVVHKLGFSRYKIDYYFLDGRMKSGCFYSVQGKGISYYDIK